MHFSPCAPNFWLDFSSPICGLASGGEEKGVGTGVITQNSTNPRVFRYNSLPRSRERVSGISHPFTFHEISIISLAIFPCIVPLTCHECHKTCKNKYRCNIICIDSFFLRNKSLPHHTLRTIPGLSMPAGYNHPHDQPPSS